MNNKEIQKGYWKDFFREWPDFFSILNRKAQQLDAIQKKTALLMNDIYSLPQFHSKRRELPEHP